MTTKEFDNLWKETSENQDLFDNNLKDELSLEYHEGTNDFILQHSVSFNKTYGDLNRSIRFTIDFGSIQFFLTQMNSSINLNSLENKKSLAKVFLVKFSDVKPLIGAFNGKKDLSEELAHFIESKRGRIIGFQYGL